MDKWTMSRWYEKIKSAATNPGHQPIIHSNSSRKPACYLYVRLVGELTTIVANQPMKPNNNLWNNRTNRGRTGLISESFPHFCSWFQLRTNQGQPVSTRNQSHRKLAHPRLPHAHSFQSAHIWRLYFFQYRAFLFFCPTWVSARHKWWDWLPCKLWINNLWLSLFWLVFICFHRFIFACLLFWSISSSNFSQVRCLSLTRYEISLFCPLPWLTSGFKISLLNILEELPPLSSII